MREENPEKGHDNTIYPSSPHNASPREVTASWPPPRHPTMAQSSSSSCSSSRGARGDCSTKRKQRPTTFNTKTALLSVLAAAPGAMAQNCISLSGSTQCSAFSTSSISTDSTLVGFL